MRAIEGLGWMILYFAGCWVSTLLVQPSEAGQAQFIAGVLVLTPLFLWRLWVLAKRGLDPQDHTFDSIGQKKLGP